MLRFKQDLRSVFMKQDVRKKGFVAAGELPCSP